MKFRAVLLLSGKTATGIEVPSEVVAALGSSKKPAVNVTIEAYSYRSTVATMNGVFMLPVSAEVRAKTGVVAGDEVVVDIELDSAPREVVVPADLLEAFAEDPGVRQRFDALSYSAKRRIVLPIEDAKTPETRQRRIARAIESLVEGNGEH